MVAGGEYCNYYYSHHPSCHLFVDAYGEADHHTSCAHADLQQDDDGQTNVPSFVAYTCPCLLFERRGDALDWVVDDDDAMVVVHAVGDDAGDGDAWDRVVADVVVAAEAEGGVVEVGVDAGAASSLGSVNALLC
mmetsp:Transcript_14738/g.32563  ORF Transcript_14738/g.32563 Transcript_14738/m.32563 type:complete len:134 (+) Transcript_14738:1121-1522(+)